MEYVNLGSTGLMASRLSLGTALFGVAPVAEDVNALVDAALEGGINFFDTANTYGNRRAFDRPGVPGAHDRASAEELLGRALRSVRDDVIISSKVSEPVGNGVNDAGLSRFHIVREVERSLKRLGTDRIDLYHAHHPDPTTPLDETMAAFDHLVTSGKVLYVGLSTYPGWLLTAADALLRDIGSAKVACTQQLYNLLNRDIEVDVIPAAHYLGIKVNVFSPLASGLLAGPKGLDKPVSGWQRFGAPIQYSADSLAFAERLASLSTEWGVATSVLALRWVLSRPTIGSAIIGPESVGELTELLEAGDSVLTDEQVGELSRCAPALLNSLGFDVGLKPNTVLSHASGRLHS